MRSNGLFILFLLSASPLFAQMWNGVDTLYGNEWIKSDQSYYKIEIAEDGVFQLSYAAMQEAGLPVSQLNGNQLQLFRDGQEVPMFRSNSGSLQAGDYFEFCAKQNRAALDTHLFQNPDQDLLNPYYSMYTDTAAYYLTWNNEAENQSFESTANDLNNAPPKEEWFWHEAIVEYHTHSIKKTTLDGVSESIYDTGEGFARSYNNNTTTNINLQAIYESGPNSTFAVRLVSSHGVNHELKLSRNGQVVQEETWSGTQLKEYQWDVATSSLQDQEQVQVQGGTSSNDRYAVAFAKIRYPRRYDFNNADYFQFEVAGGNSDRYLEIENFDTGGGAPILYDITNQIRLTADLQGDLVRFRLPASAEMRALILVSANNIQSINKLEAVDFIDYEALSSDYIILSHSKLFDDGNGDNWVQAYANYRASVEGGNFEPLVVDVEQLYDQFGYGVARHPQAIRNFAHFMQQKWEVPPRYFFIIGKGRTYIAIRTNSQLSSEAAQNFAVPTFGRPGGDNLLLATHENSAPIYALGRLAVSDAQDIRIYLDKVKGYENLQKSTAEEDRAWRKEIIHLGGGTSPGEQNNIQTQLGQMETIIRNNDFGGNVFTFTKTSSDPIQQSQSGLLTDKINQGVNIITFFGHAGTGGFDFSIEDPSTYENEDKYPAIFSLGCLSGQIHSDLTSIGERFVFQDKKGAIAFVATTGFGYIGPLSNMQKNFYQNIGGIYYGKGIGEILKASLENSANLSGVPARSLNHQYTLNGDPAIILQSSEAPDFLISKNSATFEPEVFSAQQDSFSFKFDLQNIGRASVDSLELEIARTFPNNSRVTLFRQKIKAPKFQTTLSYTFPVFQEESAGLNRMHIDIDPQNEIEEVPSSIAENNNQLKDNQGQQGVAFYVYPNGIQTVSPRPFAIVSEANISLKATSADIFAPEQTYVFQLDTIDTFESPFLKTYETIQTGGVISWSLPEGILENEKVYYWRVSPQNANGFTWDESSFIYRSNGSTGWNQSHRDQIKRNQFFNTELEPTTSQLKYLDDFKDLGIKTGVYPTVRPELSINNTPYRYIPWDNPTRGGVQIAVLDEVSGDPWFNIPISSGQSVGQYGSNIPSWVVDYALFPYSTREKADRDLAMTFLDEVIPSGSYVIFMTTQETNFDYEPEEWAQDSVENGGINLFNILENQGAELIRQTAENGAIPYFLVYKKDDPQFTPIEGFGQLNDVFSASVGIAGSWDNGNVETDQIGPASSWETLSWNLSGFSMDEEEIKIELWGIRADSSTQKLLNIENQDQGLEDLSIFSTDDFPFLKLEYTSADTAQRTPPNLEYWRVEFEGITDLAINPNKGYSLSKDTLRQGELLQIELSIENVGSIRSDSTQLDLRIVNTPDFEIAPVAVPPIDVGETTLLTFNIDTRPLSGPQRLELQLNSARSPREYSYQNNFGIISFEVQLDNSNPILDVTFDGKYILNGDLVSASPLINIIVKDDNDFLFMSDTTLFNVLLKYPGEVEHRRVGFDESQLLFEAASASNNNSARLQFNPNFTEDGIYEMIIQAEDVSGNQSGNLDYKIQFEVITESSISNILNYPNPFSTSTQFVYTLTGSEVPEDYVLQIMTASGRMVRELTPVELGPLSVGTHRTDYAWDGTDQYGDQLANGVYLYRFLIKDKNGEAIQKYDNGTDRFFKNNIGKMVILR